MKKMLTLTLALVVLGWVSFATATIHLNSSRSNVYRIMHTAGALNPTQVTAFVAKLNKGGSAVTEAMVKQYLQEVGVRGINTVLILPQTSEGPTIILLPNAVDEQEARSMAGGSGPVTGAPKPAAGSDPGTPSDKGSNRLKQLDCRVNNGRTECS